MNLYDVRGLTLDGVTLHSTGDVFHCERCDGVSILRSRLLGSRASTHENIKVNQSRNIRVTDSLISGAEQNALDFVAVRGVRLRRNIFERAEDWCVYTKGGSSNVGSPTTSSATAGPAATWPGRARDSSTWSLRSCTTRPSA